MFNEEALMEEVCEKWLKMEVVDTERSKGLVADLALCDASHLDSLDYHARAKPSTPLIVICPTTVLAGELYKAFKSMHMGNRGLFNFICRP